MPIGHITNGVHALSWLAPPMQELYDRHLSPNWKWRGGEPDVWEGIDRVDDAELWETHQALKGRLLAFVRCRAALQCASRAEVPEVVEQARHVLSPETLTIGFARRFATYKCATLMLSDLPRVARLMNDPQRPMQLVFAGKAHPRDGEGKELLGGIIRRSATPCSPGASSSWRITTSTWAGDGSGRRRVAQHTAAGRMRLRNERAEGGPQRRAQPDRARRLVGRSLRWQQWVLDRPWRDRTVGLRSRISVTPMIFIIV